MNEEQKLNRAQRRRQEKIKKQQMKKIEQYIRRHPEAVKIDLDEEVIKEVEEKDKAVSEGVQSETEVIE